MPVSRDEAADALRNISTTEDSSARAYRYAAAAPHLILWGVIWFAGYGVSYLDARWSAAWIPLAVAGAVGSGVIGARTGAASQRRNWRQSAAIVLAILVAFYAFVAVMPPLAAANVGAFLPILIAFGYALLGIQQRAPRFLVTGVALTALTLVGFFWLREYFPLWMAIVGGGGLVLGGLWLRTF
jgi:hypothetical protein